jgi:hypothetical protein
MCIIHRTLNTPLVFVLVFTGLVIKWPAIDKPASCEIHSAIRIHHAKDMSAVGMHRDLHAVYGQNVMSEGTERQWYRMFKDGRTN